MMPLDRHVGDVGNTRAGEDGRARFRLVDTVVKVWDVIGRSVVVAAQEDDLGLGGHVLSGTNGNCGPGQACGVIARAAAVGQNTKKVFYQIKESCFAKFKSNFMTRPY